MQINSQPIDRDVLVQYVTEIKKPVAAVPGLTTFEIMTGLAFLFFAREEVDIAVIEVGLGGRLDATNIITPLVSVITSLYLDHVSILGDTLEKIAFEKGGIIKPGIPVICAPQEDAALGVIRKISIEKGSKLTEIEKEYPFSILNKTLEGQDFQIRMPKSQDKMLLKIPLIGDYQVINAVVAIATLLELDSKDYLIELSDIKDGLESTIWPGRFEILRKSPPIIVDSAHNPASISKLRETIDEFFPDQDLILVFGISEDKQLDSMLAEILPRTKTLICTQADHPRAMDPYQLAERADGLVTEIKVFPEVGTALKEAVDLVDKDQIVLVTGSIFVAASARIAWFGE